MATIKLSKRYTMPRAELDVVLGKLADELSNKLNLSHDWQGDVIFFKRSGVSGQLLIGETDLDLEIKLGLMTSAFATPIRQHIEKYMHELIS
jgi:putative polyhydroxyalkanoate system protein